MAEERQMETQAFATLKERFEQEGNAPVTFNELTEEELTSLSKEQADELIELFGYNTMIRLPERERTFFDWLQENDKSVWEDLWDEDDERKYYVSMAHLGSFLPGQRGFPICDLVDQENFYFTSDDITENDGKIFVENALDVISDRGQLSMDQAFAVEVWRGPIDQWRFAWMYNVPLSEVKKMVRWLITEGVLTVPKQRPEDEPPIEVAPPSNGHTSHE